MYSAQVSWETAWKPLVKFQFFKLFKKCTFCIMYWLVNITSKLKKIAQNLLIVCNIRHETVWANQKQTENITKFYFRVEPMFVAINLDDFWFGMKGLSNTV